MQFTRGRKGKKQIILGGGRDEEGLDQNHVYIYFGGKKKGLFWGNLRIVGGKAL